jgi:hypothetical protein
MTNMTRTWLIGCFLGSLAAPAFAENGEGGEDGRPPSRTFDGQYEVSRGLQAPAGMAWARVLIPTDLSTGSVGKPTSLTPDLFYGVTDELQLGLLHQGPMGWQARPGLGVCLTGKDNGCRKIYDNVGLDVLYGLPLNLGRLNLSAHGSFVVESFDPKTTSLALGAAAKVHLRDNVALFLDPKISIALSDRDRNDDALFMPVELEVQVGAPMTVKVLTGISGSLSRFGDTYEIPAGVGLVRNVNRHLDVGARFSFDNLLGEQREGTGRADTRSLGILLNLRT